ncbi:MAG: ABC transporter permease [Actinobacteria bacterium]|nr:ABC transporter permease [Actinomycetota bacterium]
MKRSSFQIVGVYVALLVFWVILAMASPFFLTVPNITNVLVQASTLAIVAAGLSMVLISGEIDLSFATIPALVGSLAAVLMVEVDMPWQGAALIAITAGTVAGVVSAVVSIVAKLPTFITTFAMMGIAQGIALLLTDGSPVSGFPDGYNFFGRGRIGPVPVPVIIMGLVYAVLHVMLTRTRLGLKMFAIGGSRPAAVSAGISWERMVVAVLALAAFLSAITGIVITSRLGAGSGTYGAENLLPVVAGVMIGGVSLFGGRGNLIGTLGGVLIIVTIYNGLVLLNVNPFWQQVVVGVIILGAVLIDQWAKGRLSKGASDSLERQRIGGM